MSTEKVEPTLEDLDDAIAVVGLALRVPGARSPEEFWVNLRDGVESIAFLSDAELLAAGADPELVDNPDYVKASGVLAGAELFDDEFFSIPPEEVRRTDPQHRILLECAWEALENAGYSVEEQEGPVGVFVGSGESGFPIHLDSPAATPASSREFLASRLSYQLNLKGPSLTVQTACSTSLVTVHLAARSLVDGECDLALAGGVSIRYPQTTGYLFVEGGIASPDGHCRAFDARAEGTAGGNGVGIVVLKRLEQAIADGDFIRAVLRGSAINNDGSDKAGYSAPSVHGQADVIAEAQALARVDANTITYVEGHGTATPIGDPIEVAALIRAFRASTEKKGFCALGSVKSNFGHLDAAAGITGLLKTVLALEHKMLPPSLHFEDPNPEVDFENSPFYVNSELRSWKSPDSPRRAGVSSFGLGGTNVHAILEEAPPVEPSRLAESCLLTISARTEAALDNATERLADHLEKHPSLNLADVAFTLQVGRRSYRHRRTVICDDNTQAVDRLRKRQPPAVATRTSPAEEREVVFLFSGQGAQYVGMGRELYEQDPDFRQQIDVCCEQLKTPLSGDLRDILFPSAGSEDHAASRLGQTSWTQPALFVIEYALARWWMDRGVQPAAMIGHSIGEYVAACLAGVFSLEEALLLVATRGQLMQNLPAGSMLGVALDPSELEAYLKPGLSLAAVNGAQRSVISGSPQAIDALEAELADRGVLARRLKTSHAFHSEMVEPILDLFAERVRSVKLRPLEIPIISNLTGEWLTDGEATDPRYWCRHLRETVRFADGARRVAESADRVFLEVGPGRTLATFLHEALRDASGHRVATSLRHPREATSDSDHLRASLAKLWLAGVTINWRRCHQETRRLRIPLPTYPFERKPFFIEEDGSTSHDGDSSMNASEMRLSETPIPSLSTVDNPHQQLPRQPAPSPATRQEMEQLIARQLEVIAQQLELLDQDP